MNINKNKWVESMRKSISEHHDHDDEISNIPVCIFTVPKVLLATDPKSYIPQQVALGALHHWREEVYNMHRYKVYAARKSKKYMNVSFESFVEILKEQYEDQIRACYQKFLDMSGHELAWAMAVDMAFLLERMSHLADVTRRNPSHMAILPDLVMLENQIPLFLIKKMMEHQFREIDNKSALKTMLTRLYDEFSPFEEQDWSHHVDIDGCVHLLDCLYHMTVRCTKETKIDYTIKIQYEVPTKEAGAGDQKESLPKPNDLRKLIAFGWKILSKSTGRMAMTLRKMMVGKPVKLVKSLSSSLKLMKQPIEQNILGEGQEKSKEKPNTPRIEEIKIPSVSQMNKAGFIFSPVINGGISHIDFNVKTRTLYLPVMKIDVNTEVYLRNLVAYEACVATGELVMARYTELMNGIIDTEQDAKYLREKGIVVNHLKTDKEVADLWNGMSKSVKLTNVGRLDKVVADVNKMYCQTWRVKSSKYMKTYVFASWKILTLLATLVMLFLTTVQAFCSVYSCARVFHQFPEITGSEL